MRLRLYFFCFISIFLVLSESVAQKKKKKGKAPSIPQVEDQFFKVVSENDLRKADWAFMEGERYYQIEEYEKAYGYYKEAVSINSDILAAYYQMANIHLERREYDQAAEFSQKALDGDPKNKYYYLAAAEAYTKTGNLEKAIQVFQKLTTEIEGTENYYFDLAALHLMRDEYQEANAVYQKVEEKYGVVEEISRQRMKLFLRDNNLDAAIQESQKLIEAFPDDANHVLGLVDILNNNGRETEAEAKLIELLEKEPDNPSAQFRMADFAKKRGDNATYFKYVKLAFSNKTFDLRPKLQILGSYMQRELAVEDPSDEAYKTAEEMVEMLIDTHPEESDSYAIYGDLLLNQGKKKEAIVKYEKAIEIDGSNFDLWRNVLNIQLDLEDYSAASKSSEKALEFFPNQAILYYYSGISNYMLKDFDASISMYKTGNQLSGKDQTLQVLFQGSLGDAYNGAEQHKKSDKAYEATLELDPDNDHALNNYSYFLSLRKENLAKAKIMSSKLIKIHPDSPTYLDTHAWVLYTLGEYEEARTHIEQAIATGEASATIVEHYGDILFKLNEIDAAVEQWEKAKSIDPSLKAIDKKIADRKLYE